MKWNWAISFFIVLGLLSCRQDENSFSFEKDNNKLKIKLNQCSDSLSILELYLDDSIKSTWSLKYPIYKFDHGDVNGDGIPEIAIGLIKTTRFDPKPDKRLFLFRITDDYYIRPLWLGSRVSQPLEDFRLTGDSVMIRTIEKEQNGTYLVAEYKYKGFGLEFKEYLKREINLKEARKILND